MSGINSGGFLLLGSIATPILMVLVSVIFTILRMYEVIMWSWYWIAFPVMFALVVFLGTYLILGRAYYK